MKEQFQKIYGQVKDLFLSMTPGNRIVAALLSALLLVSLGYLVVGSVKPAESGSKYVNLYNGYHFTKEEQRAVEDALSKGGLKGHEWIGDQLRVPKVNQASYAAQISVEKAVGDRGASRLFKTAQELGVWEGGKIIDTKMYEAKAIVLADEISEYPEIASASVIHNKRIEWDKNVWARRIIPSVTVFVDTIQFKPLSDNTITSIGQAVARAYGITDRNQILKEISIVDRKNNRTYNGAGRELSGGGGDYLKEQIKYQDLWNDKIFRLLPDIPGLQVETTVVLTKLINERFFRVEHEKPKAPLHEHVRGTDYESVGASRGGRPGQEAQMSRPLIDPTVFQAERARITDKTHEKEVTNALHGTETNAEVIPYIPERVFASLRIPRDYVRANWIAKNKTRENPEPEPTPEQLAEEESDIRTKVRRIVGKQMEEYRNPKSPDPLDMVEVEFYNSLIEPEPELTAWQKIRQWLGVHWQNLGLMGLVLGGLCVLWSITRPAKPDPIVIYEAPEIPLEVFEAHAQAKADAEAEALTDEDDEEMQRTLEGFDRSIRSLQEEIAELVEENPDAAAAVLRQWIGNIVPVESK